MKVHQLDCTKFDVYAAGAVLFFVLENTFPGHGGLSRFERPSPEALRWIVRRAMSEYNQRYESAEAMLADLQVVLQSDDPYAVRPAELPSMGGGAPPAPAKEAPPINPAAGVAVAAAAAAAAPRPRLKVVNWWTGAYEFEHDQPAASPRGRGRSVRRTPARAAAARPGRRSASDQRAAAYERARTARARAMARRKQAVPESGTSAGVVVVSILVLGGLLAGVGVLGSALSKRSSSGTASVGHGPSAVLGAAAGDSLFILPAGDAAALAATPTVVRRAILLVNDHEHPEHPVVRAELAEVIEKHTREGLHVVHGQPADERAADLLRKYRERPDRFASSLGDELEDRGLYGLLHVTGFGDDFTAKLIESQRHGAAERRYRLGPEAAVPAPTGTERLLVIDDHPRANIGDEELLSEGLDRFERAGWELISSIEDEGALRPLLPVWGLDLGHAARHRVSAALAERGLTGIVRLETDPEARHSRMIYFLGEPVQTVLED